MDQGVGLNQESISCSICLDLLKDPATIPCGHSYCLRCIRTHWDVEDQRRVCSCPQCRKDFIPRPVLVKNIVLAELVEELKKTGLQDAPADHCYAGPEDVSCDVCSERKLKAAKSCLVCLASYCEKHLQPHHEAPPLQKHQLVEPCKELQENICPRHGEVMKVFCRTDQQCICYLCSMDEHQGHETVSAAVGKAEKQKELEESRQQIQQRIQDQEKDVKLLQEEVEAINVSADQTVEDTEEIFTQLIRLIQKRSSDVKQQIRSQQETEVRRVLELQEQLEQEITELKRRDAELEQLSHTEDHKQFLHNYPSVSALRESPHSSSIKTHPRRHFEDVPAAVEELRDRLQEVLRDTWTNISLRVSEVDLLLPEPEPKTRDEFLKYSRELTFDPNSAHRRLTLSEDNRKVTVMDQQSRPDHPDRFTDEEQVLSRESLRGRCYWEVEWSRWGGVVAVTYKDISRAGSSDECRFGGKNKKNPLTNPMMEVGGSAGPQLVYITWPKEALTELASQSLPDMAQGGAAVSATLAKMTEVVRPTLTELKMILASVYGIGFISAIGSQLFDMEEGQGIVDVLHDHKDNGQFFTNMEATCQCINETHPHTPSFTSISDTVQKNDESPQDYSNRLLPVFKVHSGITTPNENWQYAQRATLFEIIFCQSLMNGLLPPIRRAVQNTYIGRKTGVRLTELLRHARHAWDQHTADQTSAQKKKQKQTKDAQLTLLQAAAQMTPNTTTAQPPPPPRPQPQPVHPCQQQNDPAEPHPCFLCGGLDHWARACPYKRNQRQGRGRASYWPRPQGLHYPQNGQNFFPGAHRRGGRGFEHPGGRGQRGGYST